MPTIIMNAAAGDLQQSVLIMIQGMAGIFFFMTLFYLLIYGLEQIFKDRKAR
ncbi:MAG: OadG-related small transporter subunit [Candidatus Cloacimonadaceae bacterium]|nr:OadG-related small transporter subunit [Candidatus Cloacimonadaceae bacterium]MDP3114615.1 OadG-related small transporter subunit [Candidatus Cloacimonadaceae bacterium]